jgi:hypothetical protein
MGSMKDMMGGMNKEKMLGMMEKMMEECCAGMTAEDKRKMMEKMGEECNITEMIPRMMGMMEECDMMEMGPKCLSMMLSKVPEEKRLDFALKMVSTLMEKCSLGMGEEEKKDFAAKVAEKVKL